MTDATETRVLMPQLGESIVEATIVRWLVAPGDTVARGQMLAEVETDKATSEIPAPRAGTVAELLVAEGTTQPVGTPLLLMRDSAAPAASATLRPAAVTERPREVSSDRPREVSSDRPRAATELPRATFAPSLPPLARHEPSSAPASAFAAAPRLEDEAPRPTALPRRAVEPPSARLPAEHLSSRPTDERGGPVRSSPAVRRLARRFGLDLAAIAGSGRGGRVTREDVLALLDPGRAARASAGRATPSTPPPIAETTPFMTQLPRQILAETSRPRAAEPTALPAPLPAQTTATTQPAAEAPRSRSAYRPPSYTVLPQDRVVPFSRRREQIAGHMVYSQHTAAHVFALAEIDMSRVMAAKTADAPLAERAGVKLTFMPYVVAAVARALAEHPELNATVVGEALVLRGDRNIGVAVDTEEGLVVPVVQRADELGLLGIARRITELSERARSGKLTPDDVAGGSFTISNPGKDGNLYGASIIRQPEVAILRMGSIVKRPVVREIEGEDVIVIRPMMYAALSYDHRVIDGRKGNAFLARLTRLLGTQRPALAP